MLASLCTVAARALVYLATLAAPKPMNAAIATATRPIWRPNK